MAAVLAVGRHVWANTQSPLSQFVPPAAVGTPDTKAFPGTGRAGWAWLVHGVGQGLVAGNPFFPAELVTQQSCVRKILQQQGLRAQDEY